MKKYRVELNYVTEIEADNEQEAYEKFFKEIEETPQESLNTLVSENLKIEDTSETDEDAGGQDYICTECGHKEHWTFADIKDKGEPVCPECDENLIQVEDESCIKCGKFGSFTDSICSTCAHERGR